MGAERTSWTISRLGRGGRLLVGVATLLPLVYFCAFVAFLLREFLGPGDAILPFWIFGVHLGVMLLTLVLMVLYILDVFRNDRIRPDMKALWAVVLFMGSSLAQPIYWYAHVRAPDQGRDADGDGGQG